MNKSSGYVLRTVFGLLVTLVLVIVSVAHARAAELSVPTDYATIQGAIKAATAGDVVIVEPGTYGENIDFLGKAITVRSTKAEEPSVVDSTIIDGRWQGSVVTFASGEGSDSVLSGFKIQHGTCEWYAGAGINCYNSSPTISNCVISENSASEGGTGGINCFNSSPTISNCAIRGNSGSWASCGGISCYESGSSPTIRNCVISGNVSIDTGGGILLQNCSTPTITNCTIKGNSSRSLGGGVAILYSTPTITNCIIVGNSAGWLGGGVGVDYYSTVTITNCTIAENSAVAPGGGVGNNYSTVTITNCILWDNLPDEIGGSGGTFTVTYSDVDGGYPGDNNINLDPLFVDSAAGNYHLQAASPCIDKGTGDGAPATDKDGVPRPQDGDGDGVTMCDMGAYEYKITCVKGAGIVAKLECKSIIAYISPPPNYDPEDMVGARIVTINGVDCMVEGELMTNKHKCKARDYASVKFEASAVAACLPGETLVGKEICIEADLSNGQVTCPVCTIVEKCGDPRLSSFY